MKSKYRLYNNTYFIKNKTQLFNSLKLKID